MKLKRAVLSRGLAGIASQAVNACGGFLITLVLARVLSVDEFGEFSLFYVLIFFLQTPVMALVCEPMLAFAGTRHAHRLNRYIRQSLLLTLILSCALAAILAMFYIVFAQRWPILGAAFALPAVCFYTTIRIGCFSRNLQRRALGGDVAYLTLGLLGLFGTWEFGAITAETAFVIVALANIAAGVLVIWCDPIRTTAVDDASAGMMALVLENWRYGRWLIGYHSLNWAMQSGAIPLAAAIVGIEAAGGLRALQTLVQPYIQLIASLILLSIPAASRRLVEQGEAQFGRFVGLLAMGFTLSAAVYYLGLEVFVRLFMGVLFPPDYLGYVFLLPYLGASLVLQALAAAISVYCRGYQKTNLMFMAKVTAGITILGGGYALTRLWGLEGLGVSMVLAAFANLAVLMLAFRSHASPTSFSAPSVTGRSSEA